MAGEAPIRVTIGKHLRFVPTLAPCTQHIPQFSYASSVSSRPWAKAMTSLAGWPLRR
jgi:hypothetical protein